MLVQQEKSDHHRGQKDLWGLGRSVQNRAIYAVGVEILSLDLSGDPNQLSDIRRATCYWLN